MELVVLSGKGGTGKTTVAVALSELAKEAIMVDCDVDAPNFYLFYKGEDLKQDDFYGGKKAVIDKTLCTQCGICEKYCNFNAIKDNEINVYKCEGCGACVYVCTEKAVKLLEEKSADVFITKTSKGILSRAKMEIGSEGSGKLISALRKNSKEFKKKETEDINPPLLKQIKGMFKKETELTVIDGSPGIGCSVISSVTGCDLVLIVTEPTKSGMEDFMRVMALCQHFGVLTLVCINKYDINEEVAKEIENFCNEEDFKVVGKIPYDDTVMESINQLKPITNYADSPAKKAIENMWNNIKTVIY
ncbi:ATP-binding protein [Clostridium magnum]|uniref:Ferredoxin n=1 Tax=Clostridium magnum DSM 2767 TaxID=1121326 RepID=A0A161WWV3_9CLOT|nr:ATP-binding protein [Clostridium magnum]KZL91428.1 ferredoxin [Clostridium magnum DSM 2767]SHH42002.1 MinD superfamily P-loop ATPase, contains an inserted ferredoxin domain [Clostridium magnum DSM 2767]